MSFIDLPVANEILLISINSSLVNPAMSRISVNAIAFSPAKTTLVPRALFIAIWDSCIPLVVTKILPDSLACFVNSFRVARASL